MQRAGDLVDVLPAGALGADGGQLDLAVGNLHGIGNDEHGGASRNVPHRITRRPAQTSNHRIRNDDPDFAINFVHEIVYIFLLQRIQQNARTSPVPNAHRGGAAP
ncbi:hypothetical protein D9M72_650940 [compost metagenome]